MRLVDIQFSLYEMFYIKLHKKPPLILPKNEQPLMLRKLKIKEKHYILLSI